MTGVLLGLVKILHIVLWGCIAVGTFVAKHPDTLFAILFMCVLAYYFWLAFKVCPFTVLEKYLGEEEMTYEDGRPKSFITNAMQNMGMTESQMEQVIFAGILVFVAVNIYRIRGFIKG